jgi:hypothetical protein
MSHHKEKSWSPFRPDAEDLKALTQDVSEIRDIQELTRRREEKEKAGHINWASRT